IHESFARRLEFLCCIQGDNSKLVEDARLVVEYSLLEAGTITGIVYGTKSIHDELVAMHRDSNVSLSGVGYGYRSIRITSNAFGMENILYQWVEGYHDRMHIPVSKLRFGELRIDETTAALPIHSHKLSFFFTGPPAIWVDPSVPRANTDGSVECPGMEYQLSTEHDDLFETRVIRHPLWEEDEGQLLSRKFAWLPTVQLEAIKSCDDFSDSDLAELGSVLADDLALVASLASRSLTSWNRYYHSWPPYCVSEFVRLVRTSRRQQLDYDETLINPNDRINFLEQGLSGLRRITSTWPEFRRIILFYVGACETKELEPQFGLYMWTLDALLQHFDDRRLRLPSDEWDQIKNAALQAASAAITDQTNLATFGGLNLRYRERPGFRESLQYVFSKLALDLDGLYPNNGSISLSETRGRLFHALSIDYPTLQKETERARILVERLLLGMIGWKDRSRAYHAPTLSWLQS
ncbi:MAG: hypothetical protein PHI18_03895, partial [bacterium]|nr:hypothetical protein [bacterium]